MTEDEAAAVIRGLVATTVQKQRELKEQVQKACERQNQQTKDSLVW
jgi:hypothetical protein